MELNNLCHSPSGVPVGPLSSRSRDAPDEDFVEAHGVERLMARRPIRIHHAERDAACKPGRERGGQIDIVVRDTAIRGLVPTKTSAHTLRHTFARNYLAEYPGDVVGLATLLGHTSLDTTRIYSQPTLEQLSTRVEQLSQNASIG